MANIKSQKKRIITNEKARMRNRAVRSELKTAIRVVREAVEAKDGATAYAAALKACRLLDKAASKGIIHKRQAANRKSGVMKLANTVVTAEDIAAYKPAEKKVAPSNGNKKAARKAERVAAMKAASEAKALRRAEQLKQEAAAAAIEQSLFCSEESCKNRSQATANAVYGRCAYGVVNLQHSVNELYGVYHQYAADGADDDRTQWRHHVTSCRNTYQSCQDTVQRE